MALNGKRLARNRRARFEAKAMELLIAGKAWLDERSWKTTHAELLGLVKSDAKLAQAVQVLLTERHTENAE